MAELEFSGRFHSNASPETVIAFITSHDSLLTVLPDVESHKVENGISVVRFKIDLEKFGNDIGGSYLTTATATMKFEIERRSPNSVLIQGRGRALGSSLKAKVALDVAVASDGSDVKWSAGVDAGLLLRLVGRSAVDEYSADTIARIIGNLKALLHD